MDVPTLPPFSKTIDEEGVLLGAVFWVPRIVSLVGRTLAALARVDGRKGFHDVSRHPEGRFVPGLVLFRWDAPLFFANAELFQQCLLQALEKAEDGAIEWVSDARIDSYHTVWFELHEELLRLMGRTRVE